jgi:hypothetical protein
MLGNTQELKNIDDSGLVALPSETLRGANFKKEKSGIN